MKQVFNVPNVLSMFRLALIPAFVVFYFNEAISNHYWWAMAIVIIAGATDVVDGYIARKFNLITSLGKILDPLADKLMQAAVLVCLAFDHPLVIPMMAIHLAKEFTMLVVGVWFFRKQKRPYSSRWWGKLSTVIIIATLVLVIFQDASTYALDGAIIVGVVASIASMIFAFASYARYGLKIKNTLYGEVE